jgi:quercetin dioxygenase-like cupin family protein
MKKTSLSDVSQVAPTLDASIMHSSSNIEIRHLCIKPGQSIPQHPNEYEVIASLIAGEASLNMGEKQIDLDLFDVVEIEKNVARGFTNNGTTEARFLIIKKL